MAEERKAEFRKEIGFWSVVFLATGAILGPAVAFTPVSVLASGGPAGILGWIIALLMIFPVALVYVELGTTWPKAGGVGYFPYKSNGPLVGVLNGWGAYIGYTLASASIIIALVEYLSYFFPSLYANQTLTPLGIGVTGVGILLVYIINILRIRRLAEVNNGLTILTLGLLALLIVALGIHFHGSYLSQPSWGGFVPFGVTGVFLATSATIYGYGGFRQPIDYAEELKDPGRTVPRAILATLLIVFVVYILESLVFAGTLNWSYLGLKPGDWSGLNSLPYPYVSASDALGLMAIGISALILAIIASFKDGLIYFGGASRVAYALSKYDNVFPRFLTRMSSKGIPIAATTLSLVVSIVFLALFPSFSSIFSLVVDGLLFAYAPGAVSLAVLRQTNPDTPRPYRLPAAKVLAPIAFVVSSLMIFWSGWQATSILLTTVFLGLPFLVFYARYKGVSKEELKYGLWLPIYMLAILAISYSSSSYFGGQGYLPFPIDNVVFVIVSIAFYFWGYRSGVTLIRRKGEY
ncbi:amino acid transporter [Sulfodiicoccus acidiphilus]|uniref:Amino acid transporter n=1 Tax=Sulfodiicoccus acidiphilus TaxID=1670455 RepID=A0A348B265_9CREN|nr:APC family permease [Sulfodiicoccus acidiphilus]BBD72267.1 amino acid transporter [Sulfodiicoccus acidiphilus]GGT90667.1 amino acid transporter [Sulfodiicoccus acidiphilus]